MNEFSLIDAYFKSLARRSSGVHCDLGIGDDCALVTVPAGKQLAITADTLVSGVHFPEDTAPFDIGYKALAVNLSDLAAMGAQPAWFTLCLTLPAVSEHWLTDFCRGLEALMREIPVTLIGGDTTRGPLSITIQAMGLVESGCALRRDGAQAGDDIYVSGCIGEAGAGLRLVQHAARHDSAGEVVAAIAALNHNELNPVESNQIVPEHGALNTGELQAKATTSQDRLQAAILRLNRPQPRNVFGPLLVNVASACIDVSDGLLADLGHILDASHVGAALDLNAVPLAPVLLDPSCLVWLDLPDTSPAGVQRFALSAGDDYELCFTASPSTREQISALAQQVGVTVARIGTIRSQPGIYSVSPSSVTEGAGSFVLLAPTGYSHF